MIRTFFVVAFLLFAFQMSFAEIPTTMSYQGVLKDASGDAVPDGDYKLTFRLTTAPNNSILLWEEVHESVAVENGIFNVILGSITPLDLPFDEPYYLGISMGDDSELTPRIALTSSAYGLSARSVNGEANVFPSRGNVGIGTLEPNAGVHVVADEASNGSSEAQGIFQPAIFEITNSNNSLKAMEASTQGDGWAGYFQGLGSASKGVWVSTASGQPGLVVEGGNAGIGTSTPEAKLHIAGEAGVDGIMFPDGTLQTTAATGNGGGLTLPFNGAVNDDVLAFGITNTGNGIAIFANAKGANSTISSTAEGTGSPGFFQVANTQSEASAISATTNGIGRAGSFTHSGSSGHAGFFKTLNQNNNDAALFADTQGGLAAIEARNSGDVGYAGLFLIENPNFVGAALLAQNDADGPAIEGVSVGQGSAIEAISSGTGVGLRARHTGASGQSAEFILQDTNNSDPAVSITSNSDVLAVPALKVEHTGRGTAGRFEIPVGGPGSAIYGVNRGDGVGIQGETTGSAFNSFGLWALASSGSNATPFKATQNGAGGDVAIFQSQNVNVARIDNTGKGFFNGGTQTGGADLAEAFEVEGLVDLYEPGDVMVISTKSDRTMEKSSEPYSTLVAGVYATKPGVLLTERNVEDPHDDTVPMGVVGVLPTKVSAENGPIQRGDLLVTASIPGHAMKGTVRERMLGATIGKALENFDGSSTGRIKVLVNVK